MPNGPGTTDFPRELRFVFVQMLFALTMGEIARKAATLVTQAGIRDAVSSYAHLALTTFLVTTSWVGWTRSEASKKLRVEDVFSWPFVVLLLDVFLVICYFIIVKGTEIPSSTAIVTPSAENETYWILFVFIGYLFWDFLTKAVIGDSPPIPEQSTFGRRLCGKRFWEHGWITLFCAVLAFLVWFLLRDAATPQSVVLTDGTLFSLILVFRALKQEGRIGAALLFVTFLGLLAWSRYSV